MSRRYRDINRGPLLAEAYQKKQAYDARPIADRNAGVGTGQARSPVVLVALKPFGIDVPTGVTGFIEKSNQRNRTRLGTAVGTHATAPPGANAQREGGYIPARVKAFFKTGSTAATSKQTGIRYLRQNGESYSHPFGQQADNEREYEAYNEILTALVAGGGNVQVSYSPERFRAV